MTSFNGKTRPRSFEWLHTCSCAAQLRRMGSLSCIVDRYTAFSLVQAPRFAAVGKMVGSQVASEPCKQVGAGAGNTNAGRTALQNGSAPVGCVELGCTMAGRPSSEMTTSVVAEK